MGLCRAPCSNGDETLPSRRINGDFLEGLPEMRAMAGLHVPCALLHHPFPTAPSSHLPLFLASMLNGVSYCLSLIPSCSSFPCLQTSLLVLLFPTSSVSPEATLNTTCLRRHLESPHHPHPALPSSHAATHGLE